MTYTTLTRWTSANSRIDYCFLGNAVPAEVRSRLTHYEKTGSFQSPTDAKAVEPWWKSAAARDAAAGKKKSRVPIRFIYHQLFADDTRMDTLSKVYHYLWEYYHSPSGSGFSDADGMKEVFKGIGAAGGGAPPTKRQELPIVAWNYSEGYLLTPDDRLEDYWKANPWKLNAETLASVLATVIQTPIHTSRSNELSGSGHGGFAFSFWSDLSVFKSHPTLHQWYSLYTDAKPILTREAALAQDQMLSGLWQAGTKGAAIQNEWVDSLEESGDYRLEMTMGGVAPALAPLKPLFDHLTIDERVPFIQWKAGGSIPPLYRVYKHHRLDKKLLGDAMDVSKVPIGEVRATVLYQTPIKSGVALVFWLILIQTPGTLTGRYFIRVKQGGTPLSQSGVQNELEAFKHRLQNFSNDYRLRLRNPLTEIKARYSLSFPLAIPTATVVKSLLNHGWLFALQDKPVQDRQRVKWSMTYLRSSHAHQRIQPEEFIRSQMIFAESEEELIRNIQHTLGLSEAKSKELLKEFVETSTISMGSYVPMKKGTGKTKGKWIKIPAVLTLSHWVGHELSISCERFSSVEELHTMVRWLRGVLSTIVWEPLAPAGKQPAAPSAKEKEKEKYELKSPDIFLMESSSAEERLMSDSDSPVRRASSSGGAGSYDLNEKLKQTDPEIFIHTRLPNNKSRYPRLCSANTNQQPIVLTQDEMKAIDNSEYKGSYDGKMLYGSDKDPKKHHYYFCPRIWCPTSKIPLTPAQYESLGKKCPAPYHEEPWLFYDADYWGHDASKPHYIGFHKKQGTNQLCLPCCKRLEKAPKEKESIFKKCSSHVNPNEEPPVPPKPPSRAPSAPSAKEKEKEKEKQPSVPSGKEPSAPSGKEKEPSTSSPETMKKEDYYLLHFPAPISPKRWGVIPEALHKVLSPDQHYSHCYTQLKADQSCFVRKGIDHRKDSLLNAIGYLTSYQSQSHTKGKRAFLTYLEMHFTPLEFLMCQNGEWVAAFAPKTPIVATHHLQKVLEWKTWVSKFPEYIQAFHLKPLIDKAGLVASLPISAQLQISRELAIYTAYQHFWVYMKSTESKNLYLIQDILRVLGIRLLIWEKYNENEVYLKCPWVPAHRSPLETYKSILQDRLPYVMLMHENGYYEPIELKSRGSEGIVLLNDDSIKQRLKHLSASCGVSTASGTAGGIKQTLHPLLLLNTLPTTAFAIPEPFLPHKLIMGADMGIVGVLLESGIFVQWKNPLPTLYLKELMDSMKIRKVGYWEDMEIKKSKLPLPIHETTIYMKLLKSLDLKWNVGGLEVHPTLPMTYVLELKPSPSVPVAVGVPTLPTGASSAFNDLALQELHKQAYWLRLQRWVGRALLRVYDELFPANLFANKSQDDHIRALLESQWFRHIPLKANSNESRHDIQTVIEEVPLQNKDALRQWLMRIGTDSTGYPMYRPEVRDGFRKTEWMFSQAAVNANANAKVGGGRNAPTDSSIEDIFSPSKAPVPKLKWGIPEIRNITRSWPMKSMMTTSTSNPGVPPFVSNATTERKSLPSKWLIMKQYGWNAYDRIPVSFWELMDWLRKTWLLPMVDTDFIQTLHQIKVAEWMNADDDALFVQYLQDPFIWRGLAKRLGMDKSKAPTVLKHFLKLPKETQWEHWEAVYVKGASPAPPMDLDIWLFAHLTRSVVLMLHRSPSGTGVEGAERHHLQDFVSSATVYADKSMSFKSLNDMPLLMLYKEAKIDATHSSYDCIVYNPVEKQKKSKKTSLPASNQEIVYFELLRHAPKPLKDLIHLVWSAQSKGLQSPLG